jgi:putative addiction module killer protein
MPQAHEYEDREGQSPFASWFNTLDAKAAAKVRLAVAKLEAGLKPNVKSVGKGVHEARIDFGPGYRAYFAFDGTELILLLGGGEKHWTGRRHRRRPGTMGRLQTTQTGCGPLGETSWL